LEVKTDGLMLRQLEAAWRTGELVGFHKWSDEPEIFLVGFVRGVDAERAVFLTVDMCGRNEHDMEVPLAAIQAVHRGSAYLMGLTYLNGLSEEVPRGKGHTAHSPRTILAALRRAAQGETAVYLQFHSEEHGYFLVRDFDGEFVLLEALIDGMPDGIFTRRIDQIATAREGSDRELAELILYRASQGHEQGYGEA